MPNFDWQLMIVFLALGGAAAFVTRSVWRTFRPASKSAGGGCGSCGSCGNSSGSATGPQAAFVPLETLRQPGGQEERINAGRSPAGEKSTRDA